jgi:hypothetical protein
MMLKAITLAGALSAALAVPAQAQQTVRLLGKIERITGQEIVVRTAEAERQVALTAQTAFFAMSRATATDIGKGAFLGVGATPQPDGTQKAIRVVIFPESLRGLGEGHRPWDRPGTTMTNATVESMVTAMDGPVLTMKYKGGEQKIVIAPTSTILSYSQGSRDELKAGAAVQISGVQKGAVLEATRITVGRDGVQPN